MADAEPTVRLDRLLRHRAWVRSLAHRLVADPNAADDVEQATWLETLQRPPRHDMSARGWLGTVARNAARKFGRSATRRSKHEIAAPVRDPSRPADELVAEAEAGRHLVELVLALDEPYRGTILLRYFEGLETQEIAARLAVPVETVRTRLKRATAQLRKRMDERHRNDRRAWAIALLGPGASDRAWPGWGEGIVMGAAKKAAVAAAVLVMIGGALWWSRRSDEDPPRAATSSAAATETAAVEARPAASPAPAATLAPPPRLDGDIDVVVTLPHGEPAGGAVVEAFEDPQFAGSADRHPGEGLAVALPPAVRAETDATGSARLRGLGLTTRWFVVARKEGFAPASDWASKRDFVPGGPIRLRLARGWPLEGRVLDGDGRPIANALVAASDNESQWARSRAFGLRATADASGRWSLSGLPAGPVHLFAARPGALAAHVAIAVVPDVSRIDLVVPFDAELSGVVVDAATRAPIAGARVTVTGWSDRTVCEVGRTTDADGMWRVRGFPWHTAGVHVQKRGWFEVSHTSDERVLRLSPGRPARVDVALRRGTPVTVTVVGPDSAIPSVQVTLLRPGAPSMRSPALTDSDGRYVFDAVEPGAAAAIVEAPGYEQPGVAPNPTFETSPESARFLVPASGDAAFELRLTRRATTGAPRPRVTPKLVGRILAPAGLDVRDAVVEVVGEESMRGGPYGQDRRPWRGAETLVPSADGSFERAFVHREAMHLRATIPGVAWSKVIRAELPPDADEVRAELVLVAGGWIEGTVVARNGMPIAGATLSVERAGPARPRLMVQGGVPRLSRSASVTDADAVSDAEGRFRLSPRGESSFDVTAAAPGFVPAAIRASGTSAGPLRIELTPGLSLRGRAHLADGRPARGVLVVLAGRRDGGYIDARADDDGRFAFDAVEDDDQHALDLYPQPGGTNIVHRRVSRVRPSTDPIDVVVEEGLAISGRVVDPSGRGLPGSQVEMTRDGEGTSMQRYVPFIRVPWEDAEGRYEFLGLAPGRYSVLVQPLRTFERGSFPPFRVEGIAAGSMAIDLVAQPGLSISGRLVDRDGNPFTACRISMNAPRRAPGQPKPEREWNGCFTANVGVDGRFRVDGLPAGPYRPVLYEIDSPVTPTQTQVEGDPTLAAGESDVLLVAGEAASIRGVVVGSDDLPQRVLVTLTPASGGEPQTTWSDLSGRFVFLGLEPNERYVVSAVGAPRIDDVGAGTIGLRLKLTF